MSESSVSVRVVARFRPPLLNARAEKLAQEQKLAASAKEKEKVATPDSKGESDMPSSSQQRAN
jgi:hypothetical protein